MEETRFDLNAGRFKADLERAIHSAYDKDSGPAQSEAPSREPSGPEPVQVRYWIEVLRASAARIGEQPPQPHTLRGRTGAVAVRLIRRALFWLTPSIKAFSFAVIDAFDALGREANALRGELHVLRDHMESLPADLKLLRDDVESLRAGADGVRRQSEEFWHQIQELNGAISRAREDNAGLKRSLAAKAEETAVLRNALETQSRQLIREATGALETKVAAHTEALRMLGNDLPEDLYRRFEDAFRGSREEILARFEVYLPFVREHRLGTAEMPILDLGCGRGEWLELLRSHELRAWGADSNTAMVASCRQAGIDVVEANLLDLLRQLPNASVGMVTAFHVVEHLPVPAVLEMLQHSLRVLKPGGAAVFETPNPENLAVGACEFYIDPTHRKPIPSVTLRFLLQFYGFAPVEIWHLHPAGWAEIPNAATELERRFNAILYGPRDYAVIGIKAHPC